MPDLSSVDPIPNRGLREPTKLVSPRAKLYWLARGLVVWIGIEVVAQAVLYTTTNVGWTGRLLLAAATIVPAAVHLTVMPQWRYRVHRWELDGLGVATRTGWLTQVTRIAPLARIQTIDTEQGPVARLFGLAKVTVTTASAKGPLEIDGLDAAVAERVVEALTAATDADDAT